MDGFSTADNPVNTSLFSPLMSSPQTTLESFNSAEFLRSLIKNPAPMFPKLPLPIYTDAGTTLPTFPSNFASFSSFCTNVPSDASHPVEIQTAPVLMLPPPPPHSDIPPPKKTKMEKDVARTRKDMAKLFQTMEIHKDMLSYVMLEFQLLRTWLVTEFCPAMRINPPAENPAPPVPEVPKYDHSSSDDSSPTMPH
jgi:hypothetical protein